jgi:eukaryotic-like serine/threonine-protein kinase
LGDQERMTRFQREAEVLASLNHPNIAAIYGIEDRALVMELVEGSTLSGLLPMETAFNYARQMAEALEAAHGKGIIHRDLKPANVKITPEGKVKVLDFGLAKALENAPGNPSLSNSPTLSAAATMAGVILGTAAYMSPEQARGYSADARSDVFSFGCVLYEMLTGRPPFQGETVSDVLASVLKTEVDFSRLPAKLGSRARDLLGRCLDKNSKRRWHAAADLRREIETILADPQGLVVAERAPTALGRLWKYALVSLAAAILASGITAFWYSRPSKPSGITRFPITLSMSDSLLNGRLPVVAVSPDGSKVVYSANGQGFIRSMSDFEARPIPGGESGQSFRQPGLLDRRAIHILFFAYGLQPQKNSYYRGNANHDRPDCSPVGYELV